MNTLELQTSSTTSLQDNESEILDLQVCVLTYKRPTLLRLTIASLIGQRSVYGDMDESLYLSGKRASVKLHILVIDNDPDMSGKTVVEGFHQRTAIPVRYVSEPARGVASARNRALQESAGMKLVAFIDDDETADSEWLVNLVDSMLAFDADVSTGPVQPHHENSPEWVKRGGFFNAVKRTNGAPVPFVATNNVLLRENIVNSFRFDTRFNATGGEDTEFFTRIKHAGHRIVWARDAFVTETIPPGRANLRWILDRARSEANRHTRTCLSFNPGAATVLNRLAKACAGFMAGAALLPCAVLGRHHAARGLRMIYRSFGTLKALRGGTEIYYSLPTAAVETLPAAESPIDKPRRQAVPRTKAPVTVVVVGQVPPPVNGQTLMIQSFLEGSYQHMRLVHVPMHFSRSNAELGSISPRKILLLFSTLLSVIATRIRTKGAILYYPPAGADLSPVVRDLVLLISTRWMFKKTAFHFHATGLCNIYDRLPRLLRTAFHLAYDKPDLAIFTTHATSADAEKLQAKATAIIPCGIPDRAGSRKPAVSSTAPSILFVGIVCEGKGVFTLLEACLLLKRAGVPFQVTCLGSFQTEAFRQRVYAFLEESNLQSEVAFPGVVVGDEKDRYFREAQLFCFPSYYPAESFGVVLIEAMSFSLPIVATAWQGIPEVLGRAPGSDALNLDGSALVPVKDPAALADALKRVLESPDERKIMGQQNRVRYLEHFTVDQYRDSLEERLLSLVS